MRQKIKRRIVELSRQDFFRRTPYFYYYDLSNLSEKVYLLEKHLPKNVKCYYAVKANPHLKILEKVSQKFFAGVEIASKGELFKSLNFFKPNQIIYTGPGKTPYEIELAIKTGIRFLNVESNVEVSRIDNIAKKYNKKVDILARININFSVKKVSSLMAGKSSKLGIDEDKFFDFINYCETLENINLRGIHAYLGTGIMNYLDSIEHANYVFALFKKIQEKMGIKLDVIDIGGGFGIDYTGKNKNFNIELYGTKLEELIQKYDFQDKEIVLELGRYIIGESGYYCVEVIDIKKSKGKTFVITSGGLNHLNRPSVTGENQPIEIIHMKKNIFLDIFVDNEYVTVSGPLCLNDDILGRNVFLDSAYIGDLLIVCKSGAYGLTGSPNNLLSHEIPKEFFN